jgi:hypothetical protein
MQNRFSIGPCETVVLAAANLNPGERFLIRYVIPGDCGEDAAVIDFQPNCCKHYLGICETSTTGTPDANTGNPLVLDGPPGTYEFSPDGVVSANAEIYEVTRYHRSACSA